MNDKEIKKDLLDLIKQYPDLPVIPMVYGEVFGGDDFCSYMGEFGYARKGEYATFGERVYFDREEFTEDVYCRYDDSLNERFDDEKEIDDFLNDLAKKAFRPAIIVYVAEPSDFSDFDVEHYLENSEGLK